ncbi:pantothenic acid transporter pant, partial [Streptococcus agalactiae]|nr:pantothenic acid transporter pant [Streptococcus agalactiae]MCC9680726.1 pantothenic acid transporter pant [Streptococcus agalactiae]MCC9782352.1 pantothenic acid transporter pant [Streptococcus agalactiae]MCC9785445.1 pantothenic acid transporter pant [Streptococcus agalactiae]MCC9812752.1 pantothenic acid transporter pant [Streptococcus agalactiae]
TYNGNIKLMLAGIISSNSLAEMVIAAIIVYLTVPRILNIKH